MSVSVQLEQLDLSWSQLWLVGVPAAFPLSPRVLSSVLSSAEPNLGMPAVSPPKTWGEAALHAQSEKSPISDGVT